MAEPAPACRVVMYDIMSGTNDYTVELVRALSAIGPLTVVTMDDTRLAPGDAAVLHAVIPAFAKPQPRWRKMLAMARAYAVLVAACLRAPRRTVLHVQFLRFERLEAPLFRLLQALGVRVLATVHNALPHVREPWHAGFYRRWYAQADALHLLSRSVLDEVCGPVAARPRAAVVIGHGPYLRLHGRFGGLDRAACRQSLGIADDRFVVLQYGVMKPYKGLDRLIDAVLALPAGARPMLLLAGDGPREYLDPLQRRLDAAGLAVRWLRRFVADEELCTLLAAADLVAFPYTQVSQSGALFLAMTFGKPCLCSDLPGFREALPAATGAFVPAGDAAALAGRLAVLQADPGQRQALADQVVAAGRQGFDWRDIARRTWAVYEALAARRPLPEAR